MSDILKIPSINRTEAAAPTYIARWGLRRSTHMRQRYQGIVNATIRYLRVTSSANLLMCTYWQLDSTPTLHLASLRAKNMSSRQSRYFCVEVHGRVFFADCWIYATSTASRSMSWVCCRKRRGSCTFTITSHWKNLTSLERIIHVYNIHMSHLYHVQCSVCCGTRTMLGWQMGGSLSHG